MRKLWVLFLLAIWSCDSEVNEDFPDPQDPVIVCDGQVSTKLELELPGNFGSASLPENLTEEKFQLGRHLFYEKSLSRNETVSCGSCHQQSKAFTDGQQFSIGLNGELTPRNSMMIANMLWEDKFFWDGRSASLEDQALLPIQDHIEMDLTLEEAVERLEADTLYPDMFCKAFGSRDITPEKIATAISIFEIALISADSKYDQFLRGEVSLTREEDLGLRLFSTHPIAGVVRGGNCGDCHVPILTNGFKGSSGMKNNGLEYDSTRTDMGFFNFTQRSRDIGKFKTPSLRNIELTGPYMHDGRFETLEEVLEHYNEHVKFSSTLDPLMFASNNSRDTASLKLDLWPGEPEAIIAFLKTLTDNSFITNPRFSDPFEE